MARPAHITQNNKLAKCLQYLKNEVRDEVNFLCSWASQLSINCIYKLWPDMPKVHIVFAISQERIEL